MRCIKLSGILKCKMDQLILAKRPDLLLINQKKLAIKWILPFWPTGVKIKESKKAENFLNLTRELKENHGTRRGLWYQVCVLGTDPEDLENDWKNWKSEEELRPSRLQHCCNQLEYSEVSCRHEETCYHLVSSKRPPANAI